MRRVVHLIPFHGIGGVERAAATMLSIKTSELDFNVRAIFSEPSRRGRFEIWNPLKFLVAFRLVIKHAPDLVIISLWRACVVGLLLKVFRPRCSLVLFLHLPDDVHYLDRLLTRLTAKYCDFVWADSSETMSSRLPTHLSPQRRVISFVTERLQPMPIRPVAPVFIFWGRIHAQKGLKRALKIFLGIVEVRPDARFIVIGPDCGDLSCFSSIVRQLGIESNVSFEGALEFSEIRKRAEQASFYLQTSELEGMAMSVVEAMQLGLVPVVTPVGEIKHYACHKKNALVVLDDRTAVYDVLEMLSEPARYLTCRQNAIATWATKPLYRDDVLRACIEALRLS